MDVDIKNLNFNVYTDKKWMGYVLDQIIHNSIKYSKGNGALKFYGRDEEKYIELCIEDNGTGIAKEDIGRIFDKVFTGKNGRNTVYKSTGIGLIHSYFAINALGKFLSLDLNITFIVSIFVFLIIFSMSGFLSAYGFKKVVEV